MNGPLGLLLENGLLPGATVRVAPPPAAARSTPWAASEAPGGLRAPSRLPNRATRTYTHQGVQMMIDTVVFVFSKA